MSLVFSLSASAAPPAQAGSTTSAASLSSAVTGTVSQDVAGALNAAGLGSANGTQAVSDVVSKLSQDAVSALQSPGSQGAAATLSAILTQDVNSVLGQYGASGLAGSSLVTGFEQSLTSDVMSAAQSAGYGAPTAPAASTTAPAAAPVFGQNNQAALLAAAGDINAALQSLGGRSFATSSTVVGLVGDVMDEASSALSGQGGAAALSGTVASGIAGALQLLGLGGSNADRLATGIADKVVSDVGAAYGAPAGSAAAATAAMSTAMSAAVSTATAADAVDGLAQQRAAAERVRNANLLGGLFGANPQSGAASAATLTVVAKGVQAAAGGATPPGASTFGVPSLLNPLLQAYHEFAQAA